MSYSPPAPHAFLGACDPKSDTKQNELSNTVRQPLDKAKQVEGTINQQAEQQREQIDKAEKGE